MSISKNIRILRKKAGLTQINAANALGVSIATFRRWEAGETAPTGSRIVELAKVLNVELSEIVAPGEISKSQQKQARSDSNVLFFEKEGTRIELPATEKGLVTVTKNLDNVI